MPDVQPRSKAGRLRSRGAPHALTSLSDTSRSLMINRKLASGDKCSACSQKRTWPLSKTSYANSDFSGIAAGKKEIARERRVDPVRKTRRRLEEDVRPGY